MENVTKLPSLGFKEAVKTAWGKLTDSNGRARRSELWWCFLLYVIVNLVLSIFVKNPIASNVLSTILLLLISAVTVRRLHDTGKCGWWVAASIILTVYSSFYLIGSGFYETLNTVTPSQEEIMKIFKDPLLLVPTLLQGIVNIVILIFSLLDSKVEENKYGPSPKYLLK